MKYLQLQYFVGMIVVATGLWVWVACGCDEDTIKVHTVCEPGTAPETDDYDCDNVENEIDNCPFTHNPEGEAGKGQPDSDRDRVGDACDDCRDEPGTQAWNGCPNVGADTDAGADADADADADECDLDCAAWCMTHESVSGHCEGPGLCVCGSGGADADAGADADECNLEFCIGWCAYYRSQLGECIGDMCRCYSAGADADADADADIPDEGGPPFATLRVTVTDETPAEVHIYFSDDPADPASLDSSFGRAPHEVTLNQVQACGRTEGVEITARRTTDWEWYGTLYGTEITSHIVVELNGRILSGLPTIDHEWGDQNVQVPRTVLGCP